MIASDALINLKTDIYRAVVEAVRQFHEATGLSPQSIEIPMIERTTFNSKTREFEVGSVRVSLGEQ